MSMNTSSTDTSLGRQYIKDDITAWILRDLHGPSTASTAGDCRIIDNNTRIPWDHPGNLVSRSAEELVHKLLVGFVIPLFFLLGTPANVLNMMVFYRQGLKERINVCLFLLALVDVLHLTPVFVLNIEEVKAWFTDDVRSGRIFSFMMNNNLVGFYGFGYGSMLVAAIISTERCLCVLFPLIAQRCIPTKVFAVVVVFVVFTVSLMRFVVTAQYRTSCVYEERTGRTTLQVSVDGKYFSDHRAMISILEGVLFGFCLSVGCPALVLITTVITAVKLRQIIRWRSQASSAMSSAKEIGVTKMLICLSIEFVLLSSPVIFVRVTRLFPSVLNRTDHTNLYRMLVNCYQVSFYLSSVVNFVVYYLTGTKYRETLHALLGVRKAGQKTVHSKQPPTLTVG